MIRPPAAMQLARDILTAGNRGVTDLEVQMVASLIQIAVKRDEAEQRLDALADSQNVVPLRR